MEALVMKNATRVLIFVSMFLSVATAQTVTIPQGEAIRLRLNQNVSSADAKAGDAITLEVLDDVKIGDVVAIRHGAQAHGTVTVAHSKRRMGRAGAIEIGIDSVNAMDGTRVPVSAERKAKGDNHAGAISAGIVGSVVIFAPAAPFFLLMHGKDTDIPAGTAITVYASSDVNVDATEKVAARVVKAKQAVQESAEEFHQVPGETISGPSGASSISVSSDGDPTSLGAAARAARAKKANQDANPSH
jgi:hypothetical protein